MLPAELNSHGHSDFVVRVATSSLTGESCGAAGTPLRVACNPLKNVLANVLPLLILIFLKKHSQCDMYLLKTEHYFPSPSLITSSKWPHFVSVLDKI